MSLDQFVNSESKGAEPKKEQGVNEGEVVSLQARKIAKQYPIIFATGSRGMGVNDVDLIFKDLRTNKIVAHVIGRNDRPMEINGKKRGGPMYEIRINEQGLKSEGGPPSYVAMGNPNHDDDKGQYRIFTLKPSDKKIEKSPGPGGTTKLRPDRDDVMKYMVTSGTYYGNDLIPESDEDWYTFLEKALHGKIMDQDLAVELGYVYSMYNGELVFLQQPQTISGEKITIPQDDWESQGIESPYEPRTPNLKYFNLDDIKENVDEAKLGGVTSRTFDKDELTSYLDRILGRSKEKQDKYQRPYIHSGNIPIVNDEGKKYDLDALRKSVTERPAKILKQNEKMQHSDGTSSIFFNVGLPALKGLAVDEDTGEFIVIDTCPGAGACKTYCYAMKGGYVQWKASSLGSTRMLNFLYNDPEGFMAKLSEEIGAAEKKYGKKNTKVVVRWHDAGDFFSPQYLDKAFALAKKFPDVDFYAYTKLAGVAQGEKPDNFKINFSAGAQPSQEKKIDFQKTKNSRIVPKELFSDALEKDKSGKWQYTSPQAQQAVKDRMAIKYSLDPKSVITYDEMMKIPVDKSPDAKGKWNVIVKPGDGDDAANRSDVLSSLLLIH